MTTTFIDCDAKTLVNQIGLRNIFAISGGRIEERTTGITLKVASGYSVTIDLAADDTYTVRRVYTRAGKVTIKGEVNGIYCDEVGEIAYEASCFRNVEMKVA
jgi:hypothetical protein